MTAFETNEMKEEGRHLSSTFPPNAAVAVVGVVDVAPHVVAVVVPR